MFWIFRSSVSGVENLASSDADTRTDDTAGTLGIIFFSFYDTHNLESDWVRRHGSFPITPFFFNFYIKCEGTVLLHTFLI